ncbi:unnamed protein product [Closterium sp. Naga37s-1]|nr:unnamed protein product [Closterium sp. Naga37s-1]
MSCYCYPSYLGRKQRGRGGRIRARSSRAADVTAEIADAASVRDGKSGERDACMAGRAQSLGFKDLQLKLLLAEAALPAPFSMMMGSGAREEGEGVGGESGGAEASLGDFVDACMAARAQSLGFKDLQLKLLLAEAALPAPFSMMMAAGSGEEGEAEGGAGEGGRAGGREREGRVEGEEKREGEEGRRGGREEGVEGGAAGSGDGKGGGRGEEGDEEGVREVGKEERVEGDLDSDDERRSSALKALRGPFLAECDRSPAYACFLVPPHFFPSNHTIFILVIHRRYEFCLSLSPPVLNPVVNLTPSLLTFSPSLISCSHPLSPPFLAPSHPRSSAGGAGSNAVDNIRSGEGYEGVVSADGSQPPDPTDGFVQQVGVNVKAAFDQGRDYNFVRMEQVLSGQEAQATPVPPSIATLQQIQLLILLALSKGMAATA